MKAVVFVGPSLPGPIEVGGDIALRPPAAAGDIYDATVAGARVIGLIDARFENAQTVRHDEILHALSSGVHVLGAASMGALRAVECLPFGMEGCGQIFEMYRDGLIDGDDEVAVQFGPEDLGWPTLSLPLVNVRATLDRAVEQQALEADEAHRVLNAAAGLFYKDRTWPTLLAALPEAGLRHRMAACLEACATDLKAEDATALLDRVETLLTTGSAQFEPPFTFEPTVFWEDFAATRDRRRSTLDEADAAVMDELRLDPLRYADHLQRAFARRAASGMSPEAPPSEQAELDALRSDLGLMTAAAFDAWLAQNRTDPGRMAGFLARDADLDLAMERAAPSLERDILDDLRSEGRFAALDERAASKRATLADRGDMAVPSSFADMDLSGLMAWFCSERGISANFADADQVAQSLGLPDRQALRILLRREFEYCQRVVDLKDSEV